MITYPPMLQNPDVLDNIIFWRMGDPRRPRPTLAERGKNMVRQWTIEFRADYHDEAKNKVIDRIGLECAVYLDAQLGLLADADKSGAKSQIPQVSYYSDDFFVGHKEIKLHTQQDDSLGKVVADYAKTVPGVAEELSSDLIAALDAATTIPDKNE